MYNLVEILYRYLILILNICSLLKPKYYLPVCFIQHMLTKWICYFAYKRYMNSISNVLGTMEKNLQNNVFLSNITTSNHTYKFTTQIFTEYINLNKILFYFE